MIDFYASFNTSDGYEVCGFDCEVETLAHWQNGEPVVEVTAIYVDVSKNASRLPGKLLFSRKRIDLMAVDAPLVREMAEQVIREALSDPYFREEALRQHGVTWQGGMSPSARYVEVR